MIGQLIGQLVNDLFDCFNETVLCTISSNELKRSEIKPTFLLEKYERLEKCLRVTDNIKCVFRKTKNASLLLTIEDIGEDEVYWIRIAQLSVLRQEIDDLKRYKTVNKKCISKLTPLLNEAGILRIKSRVQESILPFNSANQITLHSLLVDKFRKHTSLFPQFNKFNSRHDQKTILDNSQSLKNYICYQQLCDLQRATLPTRPIIIRTSTGRENFNFKTVRKHRCRFCKAILCTYSMRISKNEIRIRCF
ncbi:hypothetical protein QE152_g30513 [Popillia japonica]|uniref:Uncharacterized protein n=1 Tax=Popillia japonica TaxID=7064 RepID=A0AAW1JE51_POPJA